ncbi:MAG: proton-conducting transporter membrane subunit [Chloroflexi bacterium OHK40]
MLIALVLLALASAPLGLLARREPRPLIGWLLALIPLALFAGLCSQLPTVLAGGRVDAALPWVPAMGLELRFALDGLSMLFALIITGIGVLILGYAGFYMDKDPGLGRFLATLILFMGAMLGLVLAGNVLTMFVFWELTSVTSYLLIGYKHDYPEARRGAQQSLLITGGGGLALLVGLLILGQAAQQAGVPATEAYRFDAIIGAGEAIRQSPLYAPAVWLVFLGCFTKSAQLPFHFWLPGAMQAPTPASAFLHSATMVKAGVYLLARLAPGLGGTALWHTTLILVGGATFVFGAIVACRQFDIKALLAYTTLSMLGGLVLLIGLGGDYGAEALAVNILAHALYKSALFMVAGIIDHEAGTRDLKRLGGMRAYMPITMVVAALALLSQMAIPVELGFVAKEWMLEAALESPQPAPLRFLGLAAILTAAVAYIVAGWRLFRNVFLGQPHPDVLQHHVEEPKFGMLVAPALPALLSLVLPVGFLPLVSQFLSPAAGAVLGEPLRFELYLYHGVTPALLLSLSAIVVGGLLATRERQIAALPGAPAWFNGGLLFDRLIDGMLAFATSLTRRTQVGRMRAYMLYSVLAFLGLVGLPFLLFGLGAVRVGADSDLHFYEIIATGLIPVGILATITARSRLGAIIAVGVVGAMVSLFFVLFSAPDLALTQLLIEVLSTVFLLLVFSVLPARFESLSPSWVRWRDAGIAIVFGALMTGLVLATATSELFPPLAPYFLANSLAEGKGANVVNVILVDFRGFDTMGEITVLFIAVLGIFGLLRFRRQVPIAVRRSQHAVIPGAPVGGAEAATPEEEPVKG